MIERIESKYQYALIQYIPDMARGESLNVGLVVRNEEKQLVRWNHEFNPNKKPASLWDKSLMKQWEEFYQEEMTVMIQPDRDKLSNEYWDSIRCRCPEEYVLGGSRFILNNTGNIEDVADYLFKKLVMSTTKQTRRRESSAWATSFFKKRHLHDSAYCKYPIQPKYRVLEEGLQFTLPFYQKNGSQRAIWVAHTEPYGEGIVTMQGNRYIAETTLLRAIWEKDNAEYILLTKKEDKHNPDIRAAEMADITVMPIDSAETERFFLVACECNV